VQLAVDEAGDIVETGLNENGEVVSEELISNVADLPVEEEYIDDQGQLVRRAKDESGNAFEQIFDNEGNMVGARAVWGARVSDRGSVVS
jgi:hypothetical protein